MSVLVSVAVVLVVFLYLKMTRQARQNWLNKLDLPGRWHAVNKDDSDTTVELVLKGKTDSGEFVMTEGRTSWQGQWRLTGHRLCLSGAGREQVLDLHYFKPGSIGLERADGVRQLYAKAATNVVNLRARS